MTSPRTSDYLILVLLSLIWASAFFNIKIATYLWSNNDSVLKNFFWNDPSFIIVFL